MLSQKQLNDVCLTQAGWLMPVSKQCRYLDHNWYGNCNCLKKKLSAKKKIDKQVRKHIADCKAAGIDPNDANVPLGNNCSGYPIMKHVEQGYDKP